MKKLKLLFPDLISNIVADIESGHVGQMGHVVGDNLNESDQTIDSGI